MTENMRAMAAVLEGRVSRFADDATAAGVLLAAARMLERLADDVLAERIGLEVMGGVPSDASVAIHAYRRAIQEPAPPQDVCRCEQWAKGKAALDSALFMWMNHGGEYTEPPFKFCPWCARPIVVAESKEEGR